MVALEAEPVLERGPVLVARAGPAEAEGQVQRIAWRGAVADHVPEAHEALGALLSRVGDHRLQGRHVAVQVADDRGEEAGQGFAALGRARDYPQGSGPAQPEATGNGWVGPPRASAQASPEACSAAP